MSKTMLYQHPGPHLIHGGRFDYVVVPDEDVEAKLAEGWHLTTDAARAAAEAPQEDSAAPTRAELEAKATELGIKFDGRTSDKTLGEKIAAALKA